MAQFALGKTETRKATRGSTVQGLSVSDQARPEKNKEKQLKSTNQPAQDEETRKSPGLWPGSLAVTTGGGTIQGPAALSRFQNQALSALSSI